MESCDQGRECLHYFYHLLCPAVLRMGTPDLTVPSLVKSPRVHLSFRSQETSVDTLTLITQSLKVTHSGCISVVGAETNVKTLSTDASNKKETKSGPSLVPGVDVHDCICVLGAQRPIMDAFELIKVSSTVMSWMGPFIEEVDGGAWRPILDALVLTVRSSSKITSCGRNTTS
ncbi:Negative Elongation Factor E [Manis pentadactyla]|nr:Negative Elongation Factor E [Manis pentadactyla]